MPKIKHTATGPNGETFKRVSTSRTYSHCVIGRRSYEVAMARATSAQAQRNDGSDWDYFTACANRTYNDFPSFYTPDQVEKLRDQRQEAHKDFAEKNPDRAAYVARKLAERIEEVEQLKAKGEFDRFFQIGWASRLDLAQKAASAAMTGGYYAETRYVEAQVS